MESVFPDACEIRLMRFVALSITLLVLVGLAGAPLAAGSLAPADSMASPPSTTLPSPSSPAELSDGTVPSAAPPASLASDSPPPPETTISIDLRGDQSADWEIVVEYDLDTPAERAAFDDLADDYEAGAASVGPSLSLYENMAALAADRTGREMSIESDSRAASRQGNTGTLRLSFTWTEFLATDGEQLVFSDALETPENDSWLTSLEANQELRINTPRGYSITSANVAFSDNTVRIEGPYTFDPDDHVRITLEGSPVPSIELLAGALVIAAGIVAAALLVRRSDDGADPAAGAGAASVDASSDADTDDDATAVAVGADAASETGATASETGSAEPTPESTDPDAGPTEPPSEDLSLLADDERVERLLERNGGRMRQARIVSETGWSDAKVSQLLSSMADEERINKLRIGRENLISLPGVEAFGHADDADDEDDAASD